MKNSISILILFFTIIGHAQLTQLGADIDGESPGDFSGYSCSLSEDGNVLCIGERFDNMGQSGSGSGSNFGQVRCFQWDGSNWQPYGSAVQGFLSSDKLGASLELNADGSRYIVGAPQGGTNADGPGYGQVFELNGGNWEQVGQTLTGETNQDRFGNDVAINDAGNRIMVGSSNGVVNGYIKVYQLNGNTWETFGNPLIPSVEDEFFSSSLAMSADGLTIAIGSSGAKIGGTTLGVASIFTYDATSNDWILKGSILEGTDNSGRFGQSVALNNSGDIVAVGAPMFNGNGVSGGQVKIFEFDGTDWVQRGQDLNGTASSQDYGESLHLDNSGNTIIVGAPGNDGYVQVLDYNGVSWVQDGDNIEAEDNGQTETQYFGFSTSVSGDRSTIAAGDYYNQSGTSIPQGSTRAFRRPIPPSQDPIAICQDITVSLDASGNATITPEDIDNGSGDLEGSITLSLSTANFNCDDLGTNTVTLTVTDDDNNTDTCTATVTVIDEIAPEISCPANQTITVTLPYVLPDYFATGAATATDNCTDPVTIFNQNPPPGTTLDVGTFTIELAATDASGVESTCTFELEVEELLGTTEFLNELSSLNIAPNPFGDALFINNPNGLELKGVVIYDVAGRIVKNLAAGNSMEQIIPVSDLSPAAYFLKLETENGQKIVQIVKR